MARIKSVASLFVTTSIFLASPGHAKSVPLAPTGRWVVDFADHQCLASASYGDAKNPLFLALKPSPLGEIMQLAVVKKSPSFESPAQMPVKIQIEERQPLELSMLAISGKQGGPASFRINMPLSDFAPMRTATRISIRSGVKVTESFQLVQMPALMKAMNECLADLRRHWNIEPSQVAQLKARPKANVVELFSTDDYPAVSVRQNEGGMVALVMLIDERGKVADCMVTATSNRAALDAQACAIVLIRAKFTPAIGADGKAAKSAYIQRIRWELPGN